MKTKFFKWTAVILIAVGPNLAHADIWGADVGVLVQILSENVQQLAELRQLLQNGHDTLGFLQDINQGINDSLGLIQSIAPFVDRGTYAKLMKVQDALSHFQTIYGTVVNSPDMPVQMETDQVVAEAISMNNELYQYADNLDKVGENVKAYSHDVSPGGAAKLTAQTLGVMIHVMNQQLRATATSLKLSAQSIAVQNKKEKQQTAEYLDQADTLVKHMKAEDVTFEFPRF